MSGDTVRWGILGTGWIAERFVPDLRHVPGTEAVAVGSRTPRAAAAFADRYDIPRAHGSWAEFIADDEIDVVYVATPHATHYEAVRRCLDAGRAVLCEKPLALSARQATELVERARARRLFLMEAMWTRCLPAIRRLTGLLADGAIGVPRLVHADFGFVAPTDPEHRLRNPALGGGALLDLGIYPVTLARLVLGEPAGVLASATLGPEKVDESSGLLLTHDSGALAALSCSIVADTPWTATICGSEGRMEISRPFFCPSGFELHRTGHEPELVSAPMLGEGFTHEATEVVRCLREGLIESPLVPLDESVAVLRTLDEARRQIGVRYPDEPAGE